MPLEPLESFFDATLTLPISAKKSYVIPSPDADTGLQVQRLTIIGQRAAQNESLSDDDKAFLQSMPELDDEQLLRRLLSDKVVDQMVADKLSWHARQVVVGAVMHWVAFGQEAAEEYWKAAAGPKSQPAAAPQDRKAPAKKAAAKKAASSRASSTRRSSGNPAKKAAPAATRGASSSTTGR